MPNIAILNHPEYLKALTININSVLHRWVYTPQVVIVEIISVDLHIIGRLCRLPARPDLSVSLWTREDLCGEGYIKAPAEKPKSLERLADGADSLSKHTLKPFASPCANQINTLIDLLWSITSN